MFSISRPQHHHEHLARPPTIAAYNNGQHPNGVGPKGMGPQTTNHNHHLHQQLQDAGSSNGPRLMPKIQQHDGYHPQQQAQYQHTVAPNSKQHLNHHHHQHPHPHPHPHPHHQQHINHQTPTSQLPSLNQGPNLHHQMGKFRL